KFSPSKKVIGIISLHVLLSRSATSCCRVRKLRHSLWHQSERKYLGDQTGRRHALLRSASLIVSGQSSPVFKARLSTKMATSRPSRFSLSQYLTRLMVSSTQGAIS